MVALIVVTLNLFYIRKFLLSEKFPNIQKNTVQNSVFRGLGCYKTVSSSYGNRTRDSAVRGRRLNRLTNEPCITIPYDFYNCKCFFKKFSRKKIRLVMAHTNRIFSVKNYSTFPPSTTRLSISTSDPYTGSKVSL